MSLIDKWRNDPLVFTPINNDDLVCKDCSCRHDRVISCMFYKQKPSKILRGATDCDFYEKEAAQ